jgi:hypothetical protein
LIRALVVAAAIAWPTIAAAQIPGQNETSFSPERFTPPVGPGSFFWVQDAQVLGHLAWSAGVTANLMSRPLILRDVNTDETVSEPIRTRLGADLLAGIGLGSRFQLGLAVPVVAAQSGDRLAGIGLDESELATTALGDLRLSATARVEGRRSGLGAGLGLGVTLTLPTGDDEQFSGEKGTVVEWRVIGSYGWRSARLAANVGPRLRTEEVVLLSPAQPHGNELMGGLAGEIAIPGTGNRLLALAEWTFVRGDEGPSPDELRLGGRFRLASGWSIVAGAGTGTSSGEIGAPRWRILAGVRLDSETTTDLDGDGIADSVDRCPHEKEDRDGFEDSDGCPDLDNDGDGIPDVVDKCPQHSEDFDGFDDSDGCPELDNDGDGIPDDEDPTPNLYEPRKPAPSAPVLPDPVPDPDAVTGHDPAREDAVSEDQPAPPSDPDPPDDP